MLIFAIFMCSHGIGCARYDNQVYSVRRVCEASILAQLKDMTVLPPASYHLDAHGRLLVAEATDGTAAVYAECASIKVNAPAVP